MRVYPPWIASITMLVCRTYTRVSVFPSRVGMLRSRTGEAGTRRIPTIPSTDRRGATRRTVDASKVWPMRAGHCRLHRGIFARVPDSRPPARFTPDGTLRVKPQGPAVQGTQVDFLLPTLKKTLPNGFARRPSICLRFRSLRERCADGHMKSRAEGRTPSKRRTVPRRW